MDPTPQPGTDHRRVAKKRNRAPVSCGHCRIRKLKCNRAKPCESCLKTGDAATCFYVSDRPKVPYEGHSPSIQPSRHELINRIDRLEKLVLSAMSNQSQPAVPANEIPETSSIPSGISSEPEPFESMKEIHKIEIDPDVDQLSTAFGVMKVVPDKTIYFGGAHWVSIMSEIYEFRNFLDTNHENLEHDALENRASSTATSLLRGTSIPKTLEELNTYVPSRPIADELIARYFNHNTSLLPIIHEPTFRKQYNQYWDDPSKAKIIWLALLFSIFNHVQLSSQETGDPVWDLGIHSTYRDHAIDCLLAGNYVNPGAHTIEALLLYAQAEWMSSQDAIIDTSVVIGMIIRLAMRMGIHRDSKAHPDITAFEGEMRRRVWALICVMDILYSFQISLPANIHLGEYDCELPRNIFDSEFDENTIDLPPSRPLTETTEVSYLILRARMLFVFRGILTLTESGDKTSVEDVMKYEQSLEEARRMIPPNFQMPPLGESKIVSLRLKRTRINLDRIYQMSQCILHRKFLKPDPAFIQYRRLCIDAAMTLLSHQATVYLDCDLTPSIYPQNIGKRHLATLTTHDFFIACMVIALDLHYGFESEPFEARSADIALWGYDRRNEMITALETSIEFWRISREESVEAAKAYGLFSFVLSKVKNAQLLARFPPGTNPTIDESLINYEPTHSNDTIDLKDSAWPPEFDLNMWNSWRGDGDAFESLAQWDLFDIKNLP